MLNAGTPTVRDAISFVGRDAQSRQAGPGGISFPDNQIGTMYQTESSVSSLNGSFVLIQETAMRTLTFEFSKTTRIQLFTFPKYTNIISKGQH